MFTPIFVGGVYQFTKEAYAELKERNGERAMGRRVVVTSLSYFTDDNGDRVERCAALEPVDICEKGVGVMVSLDDLEPIDYSFEELW